MRIGEYLEQVRKADGSEVIRCRCGHEICRADENYKLHLARRVGPVRCANRHVNPLGLGGERFEFRQFLCPACGLQLETEVALATDPVLWDTQILGPAPAQKEGRE